MNRRDALDAQQRFNERVQRQLQTMAPGNPDGRFRSAAPIAQRPPRPEVYRRGNGVGGMTFLFRGALVTAVSQIMPITTDFTLAGFRWAFRITGTTSTVVQAEVGGLSVGSFTLPAATTSGEDTTVTTALAAGDLLQLRVISAGTGAVDLTLVPEAA